MAQASTYFYDGNSPDKQTLHRRITPSDAQFEEQQARWNALADFILPKIADVCGHKTRSWLQGSYKFGTQVRPVHMGDEFDIDLGLYFCWAGSSEDGEYGPKKLKAVVQDALLEFTKINDDVREVVQPPKMRCSRIRFRGYFHIDTPVYHLDEERDTRSLATEDDEWEQSDPKAIFEWFKSQFDDYLRGRVRRLIRYAKAWAALKFRGEDERPSSTLLMVLITKAVANIDNLLPGPEDEAFAKVLSEVSSIISNGQDIRNPVDDSENLAGRLSDNGWATFVDRFRQLIGIAESAIDAPKESDACTIWSIPFEHLFPLPEATALNEEARQLPALRTMPDVQVIAVSRDNKAFQYRGANEIGPIPKNCDITFRVTNAYQMPYGTQFYWIVRNEGDEAEDFNDLGHKAGDGLTATEHSAYNGTHFMDCTAIQGNRIIGITRVMVRIHSAKAPRRNPPKPAWVRLRGRK